MNNNDERSEAHGIGVLPQIISYTTQNKVGYSINVLDSVEAYEVVMSPLSLWSLR
jgi:hypothetical protein